MPSHKLKNYRFRIIDNCLSNTSRRWTLQNLIDEVSLKLYGEFGVKKVSKRTIQYDIALMREEPPKGFNAPIVCVDGVYFYSDENFSISKAQLSKPDIDNLNEAAQILRQYRDFSHIGGLHKIIEKIECITSINPGPGSNIINFEKQGLSQLNKTWLTNLYDAIQNKQVLEISIDNKKLQNLETFLFHSYVLREYHSNWYLYGFREDTNSLEVVSVSMIASISPKILVFRENDFFDPFEYFDKLIGITPSETTKVQQVKLWFGKEVSKTIIQNPIHHSMEVLSDNDEGINISLKVIPNKDLEELILCFGKFCKVEAPDNLRKKIIAQLKEAYESYFKLSLF